MDAPFRGAPALSMLAIGSLLLSACGAGSDLVLPGGESAALVLRTQDLRIMSPLL